MRKLVAKNLEDLPMVARSILEELPEQKIFALTGKMGAGKTTLIKAFCDVLGVNEVVASPTFSLVNEYTDQNDESIFHFDFYRIEKIEEVYDIGYEEYFYSGNFCFIEWPELIVDLMPETFVSVKIEVTHNEERNISYETIAS